MRDVKVLGAAIGKFGRHPDQTIEEMAAPVIREALADAGVPFGRIEAAYCGSAYSMMGTGIRVINAVGVTGIPVTNYEQACASSSTAFREAHRAVAAGLHDVVLVAGYELMGRGLLTTAPADDPDLRMGLQVMPVHYALKAREYMDKYGAPREAFAEVAAKSHRNGALAPHAQYQTPMTREEVLAGRPISDPLTIFECSPTSDGATAVVVCAESVARQFDGYQRSITIAGWAAGTDSASKEEGNDSTIRHLGALAYEDAGVGPADIGVTQLHDAFSPGEILRMEALGLCPEGEGAALTLAGATAINGSIPINTDGGLLSRGHPVGATGLAQIVEVRLQLLGEAGPRQVEDTPAVGLCQNSGLGGVNVHVFKR